MLVAVRLADNLDAVTVLREAVDERDDARGAGKAVAPLLEREIGRDDRGACAIIVLPRPEPPLSKTFSPCSMKSSPRSPMVLNEPRHANRVRRARLTAARARSSRSTSCSMVSV